MDKKLKKAINAILDEYFITLETNIFQNFMLNKAGISTPNAKIRFNYDDNQFSIHHFTLEDIEKFYRIFQLDSSTFAVGTDVGLTDDMFHQTLIPEFQAYVKQLKVEDAKLFRKYQYESRNALESKAKESISSICSLLLKQLEVIEDLKDLTDLTGLVEKQMSEQNEETKNITNALMDFSQSLKTIVYQIQGILSNLNDRRSEDLCKMKSVIENYQQTTQFAQTGDVNALILAIERYQHVNRVADRTITKDFFKAVEKFLNEFYITTRDCDVVEETLLAQAGITATLSDAKFEISNNDSTRVRFRLKGLTEAQSQTFHHYLQQFDETAEILKNSYYEPRYESACISLTGAKEKPSVPKPKMYNFEVDGTIAYNKLLPVIKQAVTQLHENGQRSKYQEKSQDYFVLQSVPEASKHVIGVAPITQSGTPIASHSGSNISGFFYQLNTSNGASDNDVKESMSITPVGSPSQQR